MRILVVGCGSIGERHIQNLKSLSVGEIIICDGVHVSLRNRYNTLKGMGGGIILDGSHELDYMRWLLGEVREVSCMAGKLSRLEVDTEDTAEVLLRFRSGAMAAVHLDFIRHDYTRNCELIGEKGTIIWNYPDQQGLRRRQAMAHA